VHDCQELRNTNHKHGCKSLRLSTKRYKRRYASALSHLSAQGRTGYLHKGLTLFRNQFTVVVRHMVSREGIHSVRDVPYPNGSHLELQTIRCQKRLFQSFSQALKLLSQFTNTHVVRMEKIGLVKLERIVTIYEKSIFLLRHVEYECILQRCGSQNLSDIFKTIQPKFICTLHGILKQLSIGILQFFTNTITTYSLTHNGDRQFNIDLETSVQ
jgi:hypothetical protein